MRVKYNNCEKIDLGCGKNKRDGFVGIDILDRGQEIVWDVRHGIPLPNDSVNEIFSSHFVEHLMPNELPDVFLEILRVCKNGAKIEIRCPDASSNEAFFNCHYSLWDEKKIRGMCQGINGNVELPNLEIIKCEVIGIELQVELKVTK